MMLISELATPLDDICTASYCPVEGVRLSSGRRASLNLNPIGHRQVSTSSIRSCSAARRNSRAMRLPLLIGLRQVALP